VFINQLASSPNVQRLVVIHSSQDLRAAIDRQQVPVAVVIDGRKSNAAQICADYLNAFNPNLDYLWFMMPDLLVQISTASAIFVTAQSVARERELGTFDQLMVSPLRLHEILIGSRC